MLTTLLSAAEEHHVELPIPAVAYGIIAMVGFLALLVITISFSGSSHRAARPMGGGDHSAEHHDPVGDEVHAAVEH